MAELPAETVAVPDPHAYLCKHCRVPVVDHADLADCYEFLAAEGTALNPSYRCVHGSPRYLCVYCAAPQSDGVIGSDDA